MIEHKHREMYATIREVAERIAHLRKTSMAWPTYWGRDGAYVVAWN